MLKPCALAFFLLFSISSTATAQVTAEPGPLVIDHQKAEMIEIGAGVDFLKNLGDRVLLEVAYSGKAADGRSRTGVRYFMMNGQVGLARDGSLLDYLRFEAVPVSEPFANGYLQFGEIVILRDLPLGVDGSLTIKAIGFEGVSDGWRNEGMGFTIAANALGLQMIELQRRGMDMGAYFAGATAGFGMTGYLGKARFELVVLGLGFSAGEEATSAEAFTRARIRLDDHLQLFMKYGMQRLRAEDGEFKRKYRMLRLGASVRW